MPTLRLRTLTGAPDYADRDTGWRIPGDGLFLDLDETELIEMAMQADSLQSALLAGTIVAVDILSSMDVPAASAAQYMEYLRVTSAGPYSFLMRDSLGEAPIEPGTAPDLTFSASLGNDSTTSGTPQTKLAQTTKDFDMGSQVMILCHWRQLGSQNGTNHRVRVVLDLGLPGEEVLYDVTLIGKSKRAVTPWTIRQLTGVHTVTIQYSKASGGGNAQIEATEVATWRIE